MLSNMINIQVLTDDFGGRDDVAFLKKINGMSLEELLPVLETAKKDLKWLYNNSRGKGVMLLFMKKDALWVRQRVKWLEETIKRKANVVKENIMKKSQLKQLIMEVLNESGREPYEIQIGKKILDLARKIRVDGEGDQNINSIKSLAHKLINLHSKNSPPV